MLDVLATAPRNRIRGLDESWCVKSADSGWLQKTNAEANKGACVETGRNLDIQQRDTLRST